MAVYIAAGFFAGALSIFLALGFALSFWFLVLPLAVLAIKWRFIAVGFFGGALWFYLHAQMALNDSLPLALDKSHIEVNVRLVTLPSPNSDSPAQKYTVKTLEPRFLGDFELKAGSKLRVTSYDQLQLRPNEVWRLNLVLRSPRSTVNTAGFDFRRWLLSERIIATAYVSPGDSRLLFKDENPSLLSWRYVLAERIRRELSNTAGSQLIPALILGDDTGFDQQHRTVLQSLGLSHLFVISGLHIGLLAWLGWCFGGAIAAATIAFGANTHGLAVRVTFSAAFAITYACLAGLALPTVRALLMIGVFLGAAALRRRAFSVHGLLLAAAVIVFVQPLALLGASFWLSFIAVLALLFAWQSSHKWLALIKAQLVIFLAMTPVLGVFGLPVSLIGLVVNLVAIPFVSLLLVPVTLLSAALLLVGIHVHMQWLVVLYDQLWELMLWAANLNWPQPSLNITVWAVCLAAFGLSIGLRWPRYWLIALLTQVPIWLPAAPVKHLRVTVYDVGQGLAIGISFNGYNLLYDTAARYQSGFSHAQASIGPSMAAAGIQQLDTLIISHGDNDHAGGVEEISSKFKPKRTYSSDTTLNKKYGFDYCAFGPVPAVAGIQVSFINIGGSLTRRNDQSCVVKIVYGDFSMLLPGDIEALAELQLLAAKLEPVDVLVVPHHGSKTSSTERFVDALKPRYAIVSAGFNNQFGHPHQVVINRYKAVDATILNTAKEGAIIFDIYDDGKLMSVNSERDNKFGFWH